MSNRDYKNLQDCVEALMRVPIWKLAMACAIAQMQKKKFIRNRDEREMWELAMTILEFRHDRNAEASDRRAERQAKRKRGER